MSNVRLIRTYRDDHSVWQIFLLHCTSHFSIQPHQILLMKIVIIVSFKRSYLSDLLCCSCMTRIFPNRGDAKTERLIHSSRDIQSSHTWCRKLFRSLGHGLSQAGYSSALRMDGRKIVLFVVCLMENIKKVRRGRQSCLLINESLKSHCHHGL